MTEYFLLNRRRWTLAATTFTVLTTLAAGLQGAPANYPPLIREVKLLSANTGWTLVGDHLLWSDNLGVSWLDITPPHTKRLDEVFFLNPSAAWAVIVPAVGDPNSLSIAKTMDGGATWSANPFRCEKPQFFSEVYAGGAAITFVDVSHGWLLLQRTSSSNFSFGDLFSTDDGGMSWVRLPDPTIAGGLRFFSRSTGWVQGGPGDFDLYMTQDSGRTWQQQKVVAPAGVPTDAETYYSLPSFPDGPNGAGMLAVNFVGDIYSWLAKYVSSDGGRNWRLTASSTLR